MEPLRQAALALSSEQPADPLLDKIREFFFIEETGRQTGCDIYLDTFDWRLYRKQLLCVSRNGTLYLLSFDGTELGAVTEHRNDRLFWWDLEPSVLRDQFQEIIEMRALLPSTRLDVNSRSFDILNRDRKIVSRVTLRSDAPSGRSRSAHMPDLLTIHELRGYENAFDKIEQICTGIGLERLNVQRWLAERVFLAARREPLDYGDKFKVDLEPEIDIGGAVSIICQQLTADIEINRDGVCEDLDTEFLHDFRIGVRRTRSLLSLLRKYLPPRACERFAREFKWLGSITGELRDIDVYLLFEKSYRDMLPLSLRTGLDDFFTDLQRHRQRQIKHVRDQLGSRRFARLLKAWRQFLVVEDSSLFKGVRRQPCRDAADTLIGKRYRGFLRAGSRIVDGTPDEELHALRIRGKKLRYLLEFFRSFYDEEKLEQFIKQMKRLQDNLGAFNDLSVQMTVLEERLAGLVDHGRTISLQAAAYGGLITLLDMRRKEVRASFAEAYQAFSEPENRELLIRLIGGESSDYDFAERTQ